MPFQQGLIDLSQILICHTCMIFGENILFSHSQSGMCQPLVCHDHYRQDLINWQAGAGHALGRNHSPEASISVSDLKTADSSLNWICLSQRRPRKALLSSILLKITVFGGPILVHGFLVETGQFKYLTTSLSNDMYCFLCFVLVACSSSVDISRNEANVNA